MEDRRIKINMDRTVRDFVGHRADELMRADPDRNVELRIWGPGAPSPGEGVMLHPDKDLIMSVQDGSPARVFLEEHGMDAVSRAVGAPWATREDWEEFLVASYFTGGIPEQAPRALDGAHMNRAARRRARR